MAGTNLKIELKNRTRVLAAFRMAPDMWAKEMQKAMVKVGGEAVRYTKENFTTFSRPPIKTGNLRRYIQVAETEPLRVTIRPGTVTPYAEYVHEGKGSNRKYGRRPFFEVTAQKNAKDLNDFLNAVIENVLKRISQKIG